MEQLVMCFDEPERWLSIEGYEGMYEVSDLGRVRSLPRFHAGGRVLKPGYNGPVANVGLCRDGRSRSFRVHQLVMRAFVGPCPEGMEVCHGPAGRLDNRLVNLSYGTRLKNNGEDKRRDGTLPIGIRNASAVLTDEIVRECRTRAAAGETCRALAREFGVSDATIAEAVTGTAWPHIIQPPPLPELPLGRRRKSPDAATAPVRTSGRQVVAVRWDESLLQAARLYAEGKGLTLSDVVRQAVTGYLEENSGDPSAGAETSAA